MQITLDPERQKQAKEYARIRRRLWIADTTFSAIYALAWLFLGWSISLREWLTTLVSTSSDWIIIALYIAIFGGVYSLLNLPLAYYSGFILPHRFGQSNQSLKDWAMDQPKVSPSVRRLGSLFLSFFISRFVLPAMHGGFGWQAGYYSST